MKTGFFPVCALALLFAHSASSSLGAELPRTTDRSQRIRIGAVAYAPGTVTVFQGLTRYLSVNGLPADFVLYSNYDALVESLTCGEVDIAWNTPLAHGQYHVRNQCMSQTLVMRDVDVDIRSVLVVRADSDIKSLADLAEKRLVLGSSQAAEATVLPLHFLKKAGVDFNNVEIVSLDKAADSEGSPCDSPQHVLQALREGRGHAGLITAALWEHVKDQPSTNGSLIPLWTSPPFSHCVFTASAKFDKTRAAQFIQLMTAMDPNDPMCGEVMRLEGTREWMPGSPDGFASLIEALLPVESPVPGN